VDRRHGVVFGTAIATWMFEDEPFMDLVGREAALIFTMDDFLWYQLKPSREAPLNFEPGDRIVALAEQNGQLAFGAHLVWDEGLGEGWAEGELFELSEQEARELLFGTLAATVRRYAGRMAGWIVVNEIVANGDEGDSGMRTDYPWYQTIGREFVAEAFHLARRHDRKATLVLNEFGFETINEFGDRPEPRRRNALQIIDELQRQDVPLDAFGIQGHLLADRFHDRFDAWGYRRFLAELADRGLDILITELDVLDDGLPRNIRLRDAAIADHDRWAARRPGMARREVVALSRGTRMAAVRREASADPSLTRPLSVPFATDAEARRDSIARRQGLVLVHCGRDRLGRVDARIPRGSSIGAARVNRTAASHPAGCRVPHRRV
jgi:endo-1,4-beta-xylanase